MEKGSFTYIALALLVWAISVTMVAGYYFTRYDTYWKEYQNLAQEMESISLKTNILVSYGNATKTWYNRTALPLNSTAFSALLTVSEVEYEDYGGELGILVVSVNGTANNSTHGWLYWYWNTEKSKWVLPEYSCDKHLLHRNDTIAWTYASFMEWPPPQPT